MTKKQPIPAELRKLVFERDNYTCRYCGQHTDRPHCDHVYPESRGGATELGNLVTACRKCNVAKRAQVGVWPNPTKHQQQIAELNERITAAQMKVALTEERHSRFAQSVTGIDLSNPALGALIVSTVAVLLMTVGLEIGRIDLLFAALIFGLPFVATASALSWYSRVIVKRHEQAAADYAAGAER